MHRYAFTYAYDQVNSYLTKVQKIGENGKTYNPILFEYDNQELFEYESQMDFITSLSNYDGQLPEFPDWMDIDLYPGDFNGDGLTDLVAAENIKINAICPEPAVASSRPQKSAKTCDTVFSSRISMDLDIRGSITSVKITAPKALITPDIWLIEAR